MSLSLKLGGVDAVVSALRGALPPGTKRAVLEAGGKEIGRAVRISAGLTDHSLRDLAAMDHPYARRHGGISIHGPRAWRVHKQSGTMLNALREHPDDDAYRVWFDLSVAPHARYVIQGTKVMLPRNVLWETATDPTTRRAVKVAIVKTLGKRLRSKAMVRLT